MAASQCKGERTEKGHPGVEDDRQHDGHDGHGYHVHVDQGRPQCHTEDSDDAEEKQRNQGDHRIVLEDRLPEQIQIQKEDHQGGYRHQEMTHFGFPCHPVAALEDELLLQGIDLSHDVRGHPVSLAHNDLILANDALRRQDLGFPTGQAVLRLPLVEDQIGREQLTENRFGNLARDRLARKTLLQLVPAGLQRQADVPDAGRSKKPLLPTGIAANNEGVGCDGAPTDVHDAVRHQGKHHRFGFPNHKPVQSLSRQFAP